MLLILVDIKAYKAKRLNKKGNKVTKGKTRRQKKKRKQSNKKKHCSGYKH
jgi:hypothetical protein